MNRGRLATIAGKKASAPARRRSSAPRRPAAAALKTAPTPRVPVPRETHQAAVLDDAPEILSADAAMKRLLEWRIASHWVFTDADNPQALQFSFGEAPGDTMLRYLRRQNRKATLTSEPPLLAVRASAHVQGLPALECRFALKPGMFPSAAEAEAYAQRMQQAELAVLAQRERDRETAHIDAVRAASPLSQMVARIRGTRPGARPTPAEQAQDERSACLVKRGTPEDDAFAALTQAAIIEYNKLRPVARADRLRADLLRRARWIRVPEELLRKNPAYQRLITVCRPRRVDVHAVSSAPCA